VFQGKPRPINDVEVGDTVGAVSDKRLNPDGPKSQKYGLAGRYLVRLPWVYVYRD
jgi:hypothetical protein